MQIFDAHSHVQFPAYDGDRGEVIKRARTAGVKMLAVGTQASTSEAGIKLAHQYPDDIWATVGYHPNHLSSEWHHDSKEQNEAAPENFDIQRLRELAKDPKVVAIGECGLDYFRIMNNELGIKDLQREIFLQQAELAQALQKPLMIHCRPSKGTDDAYQDLLSIIHNSKFMIQKIVHFYVGSLEITKKLVAAGFYFTFGGVISFVPRPKAGTPAAQGGLGARGPYDDIIKYIPIDRILLETDCPYVAPAPFRGKRNEPAYIIETAKKMVELKDMAFGNLVEQIYQNTITVFKI